MDPGEVWTETDPNNPDTDGDGLSDGYGEDKDLDGYIAGDANHNRHWDPGEVWTETDPLNADTDGDGLPDGWEVAHGFDPLDNGMAGQTNLRNQVISSTVNGASGDPDGDGFNNLQEYVNGTDPRVADTGTPPPANSITIGRGPAIGVVGGVTNYQEFADWTADDLIALDAYDGDGANNQGGDVYHGDDGFDSSRDLVAFYARDGGTDGKFYFRVDFQDLQAYAEDGHLDLYVVIDTGNPAVGEYALPDDVDTGTEMRWEAVVAVYNGNNGRVYVDTNPTTRRQSARRSARTGSSRGIRPRPTGSARPTSTPNSTRWSSPSAGRRCWTPAGTASTRPS